MTGCNPSIRGTPSEQTQRSTYEVVVYFGSVAWVCETKTAHGGDFSSSAPDHSGARVVSPRFQRKDMRSVQDPGVGARSRRSEKASDAFTRRASHSEEGLRRFSGRTTREDPQPGPHQNPFSQRLRFHHPELWDIRLILYRNGKTSWS